jgi:hypothetical protein
MPPVESSVIQRVEYDREDKTLFVIFADGDTYAYLGVPQHVHQAFMVSESKGRFYAHAVRGRYECRKLDFRMKPRGRKRA